MSTAVIWPKSKPEVESQYGGRLGEFNGMLSQSHLPHCRVLPPGEFNDMSSQSHVSRCRVGLLPLGEFTVMIPERTYHIAGCSHLAKSMSRLCHIAGCKNSIRHSENRFLPYFIFFCFLNVVWDLTSGGFRIVSDTLVLRHSATKTYMDVQQLTLLRHFVFIIIIFVLFMITFSTGC